MTMWTVEVRSSGKEAAPAAVRTPEVREFLMHQHRLSISRIALTEMGESLADPKVADAAYDEFWRTEVDAQYGNPEQINLGYLVVKVA